MPCTAAARCGQAYAADRRQRRWRVAPPEQCGRPALPIGRPRRTCGDVRGVCPILVLVNRLQKEDPA
ncbi:hypothetical protein BSZ22_04860 [Bradyrhizobium canariense]|nr:hypothetical protein BSZ22_04860 [Bradyrhizobium canariense]OSI81854.1 hypothetical protein BSZ23_04380 [Bradyrhizobium canariense]OSI95734.1 hypothetical protein BSZ25_03620 [Bradyrhizobium canariense]OSI96309.1 hypothetical protein BSZ24_04815 [Bradyrhizobium canariense]